MTTQVWFGARAQVTDAKTGFIRTFYLLEFIKWQWREVGNNVRIGTAYESFSDAVHAAPAILGGLGSVQVYHVTPNGNLRPYIPPCEKVSP